MTNESSSPSYQRRQALREAAATSSRLVQASRPLTESLKLAGRLYLAFCQAVDARQVDAAYVYGLRFANLALESLPRHPQWKQPYHAKEKRRLADQVDQAIAQMEILKQRMDAEELLRQQQMRIEQEKRQKMEEQMKQEQEERRRKREQAQQRLAEERQRVLEAHRKEQQEKATAEASKKQQQAIQQSAMEKLQALKVKMCKTNVAAKQEATEKHETMPAALTAPVKPGEAAAISAPLAKEESDQSPTRKQAPSNSSSSMAKNTSATPAKTPTTVATSPKMERKMTPRRSKEQATIDSLERAINIQEARMKQIESQQIPQLLRVAKEHLRRFRAENEGKDTKKMDKQEKNQNHHRRAALHCLARKKKLERQVEVGKTAIFQMETQVFMLENAMEDRQVQKTLAEASQAMSSLQSNAVVDASLEAFAEDLTACLASDNAISQFDEDDEELLQELQQWISSPEEAGKNAAQDATLTEEEAGMLALPPTLSNALPSLTNPASADAANEEKESSSTGTMTASVHNLMKAVLG